MRWRQRIVWGWNKGFTIIPLLDVLLQTSIIFIWNSMAVWSTVSPTVTHFYVNDSVKWDLEDWFLSFIKLTEFCFPHDFIFLTAETQLRKVRFLYLMAVHISFILFVVWHWSYYISYVYNTTNLFLNIWNVIGQ